MSAEATSLSWILASRQPRQLAGFYAELLNTSVRTGLADHHWIVPLGTSGTLQIYTPSRNRPWPSSGSVLAPCLQRQVEADPLAALTTWQEQVMGLGGRSTEPPRLEPFGAECWMEDPEGQRFLLLVLPVGPAPQAKP